MWGGPLQQGSRWRDDKWAEQGWGTEGNKGGGWGALWVQDVGRPGGRGAVEKGKKESLLRAGQDTLWCEGRIPQRGQIMVSSVVEMSAHKNSTPAVPLAIQAVAASQGNAAVGCPGSNWSRFALDSVLETHCVGKLTVAFMSIWLPFGLLSL